MLASFSILNHIFLCVSVFGFFKSEMLNENRISVCTMKLQEKVWTFT